MPLPRARPVPGALGDGTESSVGVAEVGQLRVPRWGVTGEDVRADPHAPAPDAQVGV